MKIILTKDIAKLGAAGSVVNVKDGYARNYLLPQGFAILATAYNLTKVEEIKKVADEERLERENKLKAFAAQIDGTELTFLRKVDENEHLFGSVSENDIVQALAEKDIDVHKSTVKIDKHLKELGEFDVVVALTQDITATLKVKIDKE
jgi:large subunit ribosomal protein L9